MHWMDLLVFDPLVERLRELDEKLDGIQGEFTHTHDPLGLLDDSEAIAGDGFLCCQLYMIERKGEWPSERAYACGPRHKGRFFAQIVHAAGNYRKHRGEWPTDPSRWRDQQHRTIGVFQGTGVVEPEFWLWQLLV